MLIQFLLRKFAGTYFDFSIEGMSKPLFRLPRFVGWGENVVTVGQHSIHTYLLARFKYPTDYRIQLLALIHDIPETFYGDIPSYFKQALHEDTKLLFRQVDEEIYTNLGVLSPLASEKEKIKELDLTALTLEAYYLFGQHEGNDFHMSDWPTPFTWDSWYLHYSLRFNAENFIHIFKTLKELSPNATES